MAGQAHKVVDQAKDAVADQVSERQRKGASNLDTVAKALHKTSEDLADNVAAPYVEKAAAALDRMAGSVRNARLSDILAKTESFARREPLLFMGGAFALGLVAARFLKSSARTPSDAAAADAGDDADGPRTQRMLAAPDMTGETGGTRGPYGSH